MTSRAQGMRKGLSSSLRLLLAIASLLIITQTATADERSSDKQKKSSEKPNRPVIVYRLEFTVDEFLEGKRVNTRNFSMILKEGETNRVRMGTKMLTSSAGAEMKFTDLGVKFDCKVEEHDGVISLDSKLDLNELATTEDGKPAPITLIRNFQAEVETAIPLDKNTVLGIYDDSSSKRRYELRATVTKVKATLANH